MTLGVAVMFQGRILTKLVLQEHVGLLQHQLRWEQLDRHPQWLMVVLHVQQDRDQSQLELLSWLSCGVLRRLAQESRLRALHYHVLLRYQKGQLLHASERQLLDLWQQGRCHLLDSGLAGLEDHHHP